MFSFAAAGRSLFSSVVAAACLVVIALDRTGVFPALRPVTSAMYSWMLLLAGFALILGAANLLGVHIRRILKGASEWTNSLALVLTLLVVFSIGAFGSEGVTGFLNEWVFDSIIAPGQAMLFALLGFFMAAAAYQFLRVGQPGGGWMLSGAVLMVLTQAPAIGGLFSPFLPDLTSWLLAFPVMAALRGALLGGSLALIVVSVRLIIRN